MLNICVLFKQHNKLADEIIKSIVIVPFNTSFMYLVNGVDNSINYIQKEIRINEEKKTKL